MRSLVAAIALALSFGVSVQALPPVEAFGNDPAISRVKLSPTGTHLAAVQSLKGRPVLAIYALGETDPNKRVKVMDLELDRKGEQKVNWITWLNDETIGISFYYEGMRGGTPTHESRLMAIDRDLSHARQIPKPVESNFYNSQIQDRILDHLDSDPEYILMALDREGLGRQLSVYKVRIATGSLQTVIKGGSDVASYLTDSSGTVRLQQIITNKTKRLEYRSDADSDWQVL